MRVELTAEAEQDLEAIGDHIARDSLAIAFLRQLRAKCLGLAEHPNRFPLVRRYETRGVRCRLHGNYLRFYRVEAERILVLHILDAAMDYATILFVEDEDADP